MRSGRGQPAENGHDVASVILPEPVDVAGGCGQSERQDGHASQPRCGRGLPKRHDDPFYKCPKRNEDPEEQAQGLAAGAAGYLLKPFALGDLASRVEALLPA